MNEKAKGGEVEEAMDAVRKMAVEFRRRRCLLGESQEAVAKAASMTRAQYTNIELGKVPNVAMRTMVAIGEALSRLEAEAEISKHEVRSSSQRIEGVVMLAGSERVSEAI